MWCKMFILFIAPTLLIANAPSKRYERTLIIIKPDGIQRGLIGPIMKRFEDKGFKLTAMKLVKPHIQLFLAHYIRLINTPIFKDVVNYMTSGPVLPMVWEGVNVVEASRLMIGAADPADAKPGTIRGDLSIDGSRNLIHGSDSVIAAEKEIQLWFSKDEIINLTSARPLVNE